MATSVEDKFVPQTGSAKECSNLARNLETKKKSFKEEKTNIQSQSDENNVAVGDNKTLVIENAVATGNEPASTSDDVERDSSVKGAGHITVTVCGVTEGGEEVCATVCEGEGERGEGEREGEGEEERGGEGEEERGGQKIKDLLPNGKPASATFPRQHRHNYSFSSVNSGRLSPYGSDESSSDIASLSQDTSFYVSQHNADLQLVVEQLTEELLAAQVHGASGSEGKGQEDLTKTLLELVVTLKMELATVKEENEKLQHVRSSMDNEIHELTENLFGEAYKMVDEAKGGKVSAEKRLADAAGKIDAMETEMSTLKRLINSSPSHSSPKVTKATPHSLHPQSSSSLKPRRTSIRRAVHKIQKRTGFGVTQSPGGSSSKGSGSPLILLEHKEGETLVAGEIDQEEYSQFHHWIKTLSPSSSPSTPTTPINYTQHSYFNTIMEQDIRPCLAFKNTELSQRVLEAVQSNYVIMESLHVSSSRSNGRPGHTRSSSLPPEGVLCALCEAKERDCTHKMRLGEEKEWLFISQGCRNRVAAVCDFFMHVGHIQKGIIKAGTTKLYWQVARLRGIMQLARYSLSLPSDVQNR